MVSRTNYLVILGLSDFVRGRDSSYLVEHLFDLLLLLLKGLDFLFFTLLDLFVEFLLYLVFIFVVIFDHEVLR